MTSDHLYRVRYENREAAPLDPITHTLYGQGLTTARDTLLEACSDWRLRLRKNNKLPKVFSMPQLEGYREERRQLVVRCDHIATLLGQVTTGTQAEDFAAEVRKVLATEGGQAERILQLWNPPVVASNQQLLVQLMELRAVLCLVGIVEVLCSAVLDEHDKQRGISAKHTQYLRNRLQACKTLRDHKNSFTDMTMRDQHDMLHLSTRDTNWFLASLASMKDPVQNNVEPELRDLELTDAHLRYIQSHVLEQLSGRLELPDVARACKQVQGYVERTTRMSKRREVGLQDVAERRMKRMPLQYQISDFKASWGAHTRGLTMMQLFEAVARWGHGSISRLQEPSAVSKTVDKLEQMGVLSPTLDDLRLTID